MLQLGSGHSKGGEGDERAFEDRVRVGHRGLSDMMSALEGGGDYGKVGVVRKVAWI